MKLGILGSTRGTSLSGIITAIDEKKLAARIEIVISNKMDAPILTRAKKVNIPALFLDPANLSRATYDECMTEILLAKGVDKILLIGYMRILSPGFINQWRHKIINVHPSLLPAYAGKMDLDVHRAVLAAGESETGCTVHHVTDKVDAGAIIVQKRCQVLPSDTPESLKKRVQQLESVALVAALQSLP